MIESSIGARFCSVLECSFKFPARAVNSVNETKEMLQTERGYCLSHCPILI